VEQTNIERGQRPDKGVIDLIALNHYWKLGRADSQYMRPRDNILSIRTWVLHRLLNSIPLDGKIFLSLTSCATNLTMMKGFWDSVEPGRLDESQLIHLIRIGSYP
jgi:hypothetical protein